MEGSIKAQKIQAMKNYKRAQFFYNFVLYSLTSIITCLFFSYSFWFPSMMHLLFALSSDLSVYFNGKCFFIVGNLIVFIIIRESKSARGSSNSSPASDIYDEYLARSRGYRKASPATDVYDEYLARSQSYREASPASNTHDEYFARSQSSHEENSSVLVKEKKKDEFIEERKPRNMKHVYGEEKKKEVRLCKSMHQKQKKVGMRKCKSEVWGESEMEKRKQTNGEKEGQLNISRDELNKRVEAFIARVNKQRLLESELSDHRDLVSI